MTNSWSLLYDEIYGDEPMTDDIRITSLESDEYDIITGTGNTAATKLFTTDYNDGVDLNSFENISINTSECPEGITITDVPQSAHTEDTIHISTKESNNYIYESPDGGITVTRRKADDDYTKKEVIHGDYFGDSYPYAQNFLADNADAAAHHFGTANVGSVTLNIPEEFQTPPPTPGIESDNPRKYKEDESIKALQDYISTTYGAHYTSDNNNVQTLDLIESVGDAESFCRSNAIKYLSRYDKKGQAKRDILKALHYSLLLYHFSGQLNETPTRGYETF